MSKEFVGFEDEPKNYKEWAIYWLKKAIESAEQLASYKEAILYSRMAQMNFKAIIEELKEQ